jgi:beta-lactamase class A
MTRLIPVFIVLIALLSATMPTEAQSTSVLDALPNCNFTAAAPDDNIMVGAVILNLQTGNGCAENLDTMFPVASVPKVFVAGALYQMILESNGTIGFDTPLTFSERYWMGGRNDCLNGGVLNEQVTLGELSDIMISCSDNAATWMVMDAMGWETVDAYVESLGIDDIGQIIPYSEVDRQKLALLDETWGTVPISMASRFYRSEGTTGLDTYFNDIPRYTYADEIEANALYFDTTDYNSATPRALAEYMLKLAADAPLDTNEGQIARWLFGAMLLTQRQYTSQGIPGSISVAAKNGFDTGLRAEVNVMFEDLPGQQRNPTAIGIVFARQKSLNVPNLQPPTTRQDGTINQYLLAISPVVSQMLYPNFTKPPVVGSNVVRTVVVNPKFAMDACWEPFSRRDFLFEYRGELESCWLSQSRSYFTPGDSIGVGLLLDDLDGEDTRIHFVFTEPDGVQRSYQTERFFQEAASVYWFHPIDEGKLGTWTVDIYINRELTYTEALEVQALY